MPPYKPLDLKRFRRDAVRVHETHPSRQTIVGTFAAVRAAMPEIRSLRTNGVSWAAIAAALAEQGVTQGQNDRAQPITRSRLTAVVAQIEKAEQRRDQKQTTRAKRSDLSAASQKPEGNSAKISLSHNHEVKPSAAESSAEVDTDEETLRRRALEELQAIYTKTSNQQ